MLAASRRELLLTRLRADGRLVVKDLAAELGLSEDSLRRDLRELAAAGLVQRVYGGALPLAPAEADYAVDHALHALAAALLTDDVTVLQDGREWLTTLLAARGCHPDAVPQLWEVLSRVAGSQLPVASKLLRQTAA